MLKFSSPPNSEKKQCTPNLLPCRVHHDGPVEASTRYWAPENGDGKRNLASSWSVEI